MRTFFNTLAESTSSTWRLLSDTTNFLSRVKLLDSYETELRNWRERLSHKRTDPQVYGDVRQDIVALRRLLREQGYDLRLGSKDIALEGFRNDDAMGEGFQRIVLGLADDDVYYIAGSANHIELDKMLDEYYARRGWDSDGVVTDQTKHRLGLDRLDVGEMAPQRRRGGRG